MILVRARNVSLDRWLPPEVGRLIDGVIIFPTCLSLALTRGGPAFGGRRIQVELRSHSVVRLATREGGGGDEACLMFVVMLVFF